MAPKKIFENKNSNMVMLLNIMHININENIFQKLFFLLHVLVTVMIEVLSVALDITGMKLKMDAKVGFINLI